MISKSKKEAFLFLKENKKVFGFSLMYSLFVILIEIVSYIMSIEMFHRVNYDVLLLIISVSATICSFPMLLGLLFCMINDRFTISSLLHFYYGKRMVYTIALTFIVVITSDGIRLLKLFISNAMICYKILILLLLVCFFMVSTFLFVFKYYFVKVDGNIKESIQKSLLMFKKNFLNIVLFDVSFILWYIIPAIIILVYTKIGALDNSQSEMMTLLLPHVVNIVFLPYYYKSLIIYIQKIESLVLNDNYN